MSAYEDFATIPRADQIARWEQAVRVLENLKPHERKKHFDMSAWGKKTPCGTVACAAGFCGLDRWFRKAGFSMDFKVRTKVLRGENGPEESSADLEGYWGPPIKVQYIETIISDVERFFGDEGTERIFFNSKRRPIEKVLGQMKRHLAQLKKRP